MKRSAFYPGSFDPFTNGHLDLLARALKLFDEVIIGVGVHPQKNPIFNVQRRINMIEESLSVKQIVKSYVASFANLAVDAARQHGANFIIRGVRNAVDFEYEQQLASMQRKLNPEIEIVLFSSSPETSFISSTLVRQIIQEKGDVSSFVPPAVAKQIEGMTI